MRTALYTVALGAALLLTGTGSAGAQEGLGLFATERDCTTISSPCARASSPAEDAFSPVCSRMSAGDLSVGCSTILSKAIWTAQQCAGDIQQFCPSATYGNVGDCMRPHLGEASGPCRSALAFMDQCRGAIAFIASPAGD